MTHRSYTENNSYYPTQFKFRNRMLAKREDRLKHPWAIYGLQFYITEGDYQQ